MLRRIRSISLSGLRGSALHLLRLCVSPHLTFYSPAYPRREPSAALRTHTPAPSIVPRTSTVPTHLQLLSRYVLPLCPRTRGFYRAACLRICDFCRTAYIYCAYAPKPSVAFCTSALGLLLHYKPSHFLCGSPAYLRNWPSASLRSPALA